ncbi:hypothetical protein C8Q80DRAFT_39225 [Daedaleopsis nitida]|nr:hypothetical protein C8Q80DRAFT_39225 [Daedaleopsis nitida]
MRPPHRLQPLPTDLLHMHLPLLQLPLREPPRPHRAQRAPARLPHLQPRQLRHPAHERPERPPTVKVREEHERVRVPLDQRDGHRALQLDRDRRDEPAVRRDRVEELPELARAEVLAARACERAARPVPCEPLVEDDVPEAAEEPGWHRRHCELRLDVVVGRWGTPVDPSCALVATAYGAWGGGSEDEAERVVFVKECGCLLVDGLVGEKKTEFGFDGSFIIIIVNDANERVREGDRLRENEGAQLWRKCHHRKHLQWLIVKATPRPQEISAPTDVLMVTVRVQALRQSKPHYIAGASRWSGVVTNYDCI